MASNAQAAAADRALASPAAGQPPVATAPVVLPTRTGTAAAPAPRPAARTAAPACVNNNCPMPGAAPIDQGGPLVTHPKVYVVQLQSSTAPANQNGYISQITAPSEPNVPGALTAMVDSPYATWWQQEYSRPSANQLLYSGTYAGTISIQTPQYYSLILQDVDINTILENAVLAGTLPTWDSNTVFVLFFRQGQTIQLTNYGAVVGDSVFNFCGYHSSLLFGGTPQVDLNFVVMPYEVTNAGCAFSGSTGAAAGFANLTSVLSHELAETITDPSYPNAWLSMTNQEVGDMCEVGLTPDAVITARSGASYNVQDVFDNSTNTCVYAKKALTLTATKVTTSTTTTITAQIYAGTIPLNGTQLTAWVLTGSGSIGSAHFSLTGEAVITVPATAATLSVFTPGGGFFSGGLVIAGAPPSAPTITSVVPAAAPGSATVTWTAPSSSGTSAISSYTAMAGNGADGTRQAAATCTAAPPATSCLMTGLPQGTDYIWNVTATNASGPSPFSPDVTAWATSVPAAPQVLGAVAGTTTIDVTFGDAGAGSSPVTGYAVTATPGTASCTAPPAATHCLLTGLVPATAYALAAWATNAVGTSQLFVSGTQTTLPVPGVPTAPQSVHATVIPVPGGATALVGWTAPTSTGGSPVTGYAVTVTPGPHTCSAGGTATSCSVSGLVPGTTYAISVQAANTNGPGGAAGGSLTTPTTPTPPALVSGIGGPGGTILASWSAAAATGGAPVTSYTAQAAAPGRTTQSCTVLATACTITGLAPGATYTVQVEATNGVGASSWTSSTGVPVPTTPGPPTSVTATASGRSVTVSWQPPTTTGGLAVTSYQVSVSPGGVACATAGLSCAFSALNWTTHYTVTVTAITAAGASPGATTGVTTAAPPTFDGHGYWMVAASGQVYAFGDATNFGSPTGLSSPAVVIAHTPDGGGYWIATAGGGLYSYGNAPYLGTAAAAGISAPIVGMVATADGQGYWMVGADGRIYAYGDAGDFGSLYGSHLNGPIVAMTATSDGRGYWMTAGDGGIFAFGDAGFFGSMGGSHLNSPVVGMTSSPDGNGYRMVASDGGIFSFGAPFYGSMGGQHLNMPVVGMTGSPDGLGYRMVASDGGIFSFGDAPFYGSTGGQPIGSPMVSTS